MIINWLAEYLFSFAEVFLSFIFCDAFFEKNESRASKLSYLIIALVMAGIVIGFNSLKLFSMINTAIFFVMFCCSGKYLFKADWIKVESE